MTGLLVLAAAGNYVAPSSGLIGWEREDTPVVEAAGKLPAGSLVAGWPDTLDMVPYFTGIPVLINRETHLPYHKRYAEEMRGRFRAVIKAMYSTEAGPVRDLRQRYGVTHMLVDSSRFDRPPRCYEPFGQEIGDAFNRTRGQMKYLQSVCKSLKPLGETKSAYLIDLTEIDARTATDPAGRATD